VGHKHENRELLFRRELTVLDDGQSVSWGVTLTEAYMCLFAEVGPAP
jgi:hypothetical protein